MTAFSVEITDPLLIERGVAATLDFYATLAFDELQQKAMHAFITGIESPYLNVIFDLRKNPHTSAAQVEFFRNYFQFHSIPWSWFALSAGSHDSLHRHGLMLVDQSPAMYLGLTNTISQPELADFIVEEASPDDNLKNWIEPIQEAFPSEDNCEGYRVLNAKLLNQGEKKLKHFVARYQGEVVSAATLFFHDDAVMIHNLATKTAFLKRGFGTAFSAYLLQYAKQRQYQHCFLDSSVDGFTIYKKLGFKVCYTTSIYQLRHN